MTAIYDNKIVTIIDYGAGNLRSVARAVSHSGYKPFITKNPADITEAWSLIVPGVGAAADTMYNLQSGNFIKPILNYTQSRRPFLGICMGMQALFDSSDEDGFQECLGILAGKIIRFPHGSIIPHMGWNTVNFENEIPLFRNIKNESYFYFVHSYHAVPDNNDNVLAKTQYASTNVPAIVGKENLIGTQFHPEKSGQAGLQLYKNFLDLAYERKSICT
ncbi:MAG: imidazole glycerol phosphate synthase subunit HisH [Dehalococcoidia bacterium]|nr:imidazole glycerol phosphate synthase subunit HisH [Dehalococcoidia bacterium]